MGPAVDNRLAITAEDAAGQSLLAAVAVGDAAAFDRLYRLQERRVWRYVFSIVHDRTTAEELVVDTMLAVWRGAQGFRSGSKVSTWILGIARHKALDALRRLDRRGREVDLDAALELPAAGPGPADIGERDDTARFLRAAIECLSPEHRESLHLAFEEDLPYDEIAILLCVPVSTVKTRIFYAKKRLREHLDRLTSRETIT